ncbi:MAG: double-strand break repair helicase AddA [Pseudomonadota bacterium]
MSSAAERPPVTIDDATRDAQRRAADPKSSVWVSANAGSGKTYVLSSRVILLLLDGVQPDRILCLTYTKTAAAEMKNRVFERLGKWTRLEDTELRKEIAALRNIETPSAVTAADVETARRLFAVALETPGGLKIQTIHAFCETVLHRFPLEANIAGHFEMLDDRMEKQLLDEARRDVVSTASGELSDAISRLIYGLGDSGFDEVIGSVAGDRETFQNYIAASSDAQSSSADRRHNWRRSAGFSDNETEEAIFNAFEQQTPLNKVAVQRYLEIADSVRATSLTNGFLGKASKWFDETPNALPDETYLHYFLTTGRHFSSRSLGNAAFKKRAPEFLELYTRTADLVLDTLNRINLSRAVDLGADLASVGSQILDTYKTLKQRRGFLDFTDLIEKTHNLLSRSDIGPWIRYKLDYGIDHILLDEAQDTGPLQWKIIDLLSEDFFDGESSRPEERTIFVVGDEKQSIYSFQGADPRQFSYWKHQYIEKTNNAGRPLDEVDMPASFRSTSDVLKAVDHVFANDAHNNGLSFDKKVVQHTSLRVAQPGRVELWEPTKSEKEDPPDNWLEPENDKIDGAVQLATRIATDIERKLREAYRIRSLGRPAQAGDFLILVRKRSGAFIKELSRRLKENGVEVAGADRLDMFAHPACRDLVALGRALLDIRDDLSFAELIKSPVFNGTENDLFALTQAWDRGNESLFQALARLGEGDTRFGNWAQQFAQWRTLASEKPVYEFYAHVLLVDGVAKKLIGRLGPETEDVLDEFLNEAIKIENVSASSLQEFMRSFETSTRVIKRELDQASHQVRVMTIHAAKGLEAPIVYVIDDGSAAVTSQDSKTKYSEIPDVISDFDDAPIILAAGRKAEHPQKLADRLELQNQEKVGEYRRLLYVATTRAADELIITGYRGLNSSNNKQNDPAKLTWFDMARAELIDAPDAPALVISDYGFPAWRYEIDASAGEATKIGKSDDEPPGSRSPEDITWMHTPAAAEPPAPRPLQPSGTSALVLEKSVADKTAAVATEPFSLLQQLQSNTDLGSNRDQKIIKSARRGTAMHRLLEKIGEVEPAKREATAADYLRSVHAAWSDSEIDRMVQDALATLKMFADHENSSGVRSSNEVAVMGTINFRGEERAVSGVIDRLVVTEREVQIIDFKTSLRPPSSLGDVPDHHRLQIALYRELLAPIYLDHQITGKLVYTSGPVVINLARETLDEALALS